MNQDALKIDFNKDINDYHHLFPGGFYDIYLDNYKNSLSKYIKDNIMNTFNLTYEQVECIIDNKILESLGESFFKP